MPVARRDLANAVGMAVAERTLAAQFNRDGHGLIDHFGLTVEQVVATLDTALDDALDNSSREQSAELSHAVPA